MTGTEHAELRAAGWTWPAIRHGFGARDAAVAAGFHLVRARQVHGTDVLAVGERSPSPAGEADVLITDRPGVAAAIATADCVPLLVVAPEARVVAAVHAGWRGTLAGVTLVALAALRERYGVATGDVRVALGPSISGCCFEIEREIAARFADRYGDAVWTAWRDGRPGKGCLDLRRVNQIALEQAGVAATAIQNVGPCTACGGGPYASYRAQGPGGARQLSWIGIARSEAPPTP